LLSSHNFCSVLTHTSMSRDSVWTGLYEDEDKEKIFVYLLKIHQARDSIKIFCNW
jgi:hypothetical protein